MITLYLFAFFLHTASSQHQLNNTVGETLDYGIPESAGDKGKLLPRTVGGTVHLFNMNYIRKIREKFHNNMPAGKSKNFQFAVFKFGKMIRDSDWDPSLENTGLEWSGSPLVVNEPQNNWQASVYDPGNDGCHTEAAIIDDTSTNGFRAMLSRECDDYPPHTLNIYTFNSPCIITPGGGCQTLIQNTLLGFFSNAYDVCNKQDWKVNIVWSLQYRDQPAVECLRGWEAFQDDMKDDVPNLQLNYGRQSITRNYRVEANRKSEK